MAKRLPLSPSDEIKELLAESKFRIKLHDYLTKKSDLLIMNISDEFFPVNSPWNNDEFAARLNRYETSSSDLISSMALIGYWGTSDHLLSISIPAKKFNLQLGINSHTNNWTVLRWYPLTLLVYAVGIGSIAGNNYPILYNFLQSTCKNLSHPARRIPLVFSLEEIFGNTRSLFKNLPGHERQYSPASEYLFEFFKNKLEDVVFLGDDYEDIFDRFEIFYALQHAHEREKISENHIWGPVGRFGWKYSRGSDSNPFKLLYDDASREKDAWAPLKAGFFDGSYERFEKLALQFAKTLQSFH